jgi:glutamate/tyrosine decarboxylase-like PLP-dependent enzyme
MKKALCLLGLPPDNIRLLDIDEKRRLRPDVLQSYIDQDQKIGLVPAAVCVSAGTANTGAIDPLNTIVDICEKYGLWLHIDGSYGAPAVMTEAYRWMERAFARADSLSLDPHKWLFVSADAGCILVRDANIARQTFSLSSEYTAVTQTDPIERYAFFDSGLELSRRFRGLKVWTVLKMRGTARLRAAIQHDIDLRCYLDERIELDSSLESLGSELSIACFRYRSENISDINKLNEMNRTILETLVNEGRCYMSPTELEGVYALRVCIVNFRTRREDIDFLVDEVLRVGNEITGVS